LNLNLAVEELNIERKSDRIKETEPKEDHSIGESKRKKAKQEEALWKCAGVQIARGRIGIRWDGKQAAPQEGQLAHFIEYLTLTKWWSRWERDCPLSYRSPNAAGKAERLEM
jgi:hypothetical protein